MYPSITDIDKIYLIRTWVLSRFYLIGFPFFLKINKTLFAHAGFHKASNIFSLFENGQNSNTHIQSIRPYKNGYVIPPELKLNIKNLIVKGDSMLVIKQMQGVYQVKSHSLQKLFREAKALERQFDFVSYYHIYRTDNKRADQLANIGADDITIVNK
jgi:hypothetical protein